MIEESKERLIDLIEYVGQMVRLGEKAVFNIMDYRQPVFHEADFKNHIGISHDVPDENGSIWLKIERLKGTDPPLPPEEIQDLLSVNRDPFSPPKVQAVRTETITPISGPLKAGCTWP